MVTKFVCQKNYLHFSGKAKWWYLGLKPVNAKFQLDLSSDVNDFSKICNSVWAIKGWGLPAIASNSNVNGLLWQARLLGKILFGLHLDAKRKCGHFDFSI